MAAHILSKQASEKQEFDQSQSEEDDEAWQGIETSLRSYYGQLTRQAEDDRALEAVNEIWAVIHQLKLAARKVPMQDHGPVLLALGTAKSNALHVKQQYGLVYVWTEDNRQLPIQNALGELVIKIEDLQSRRSEAREETPTEKMRSLVETALRDDDTKAVQELGALAASRKFDSEILIDMLVELDKLRTRESSGDQPVSLKLMAEAGTSLLEALHRHFEKESLFLDVIMSFVEKRPDAIDYLMK